MIVSLTIIGVLLSQFVSGILNFNHSPEKHDLVMQATNKILNNCYKTEIKSIIMLRNVANGPYPPETTYIKYSNLSANCNTTDPFANWQVNMFIINESNEQLLSDDFQSLLESKWWNHEAIFLLLNEKCTNAFTSLFTTWEHNVLSAFYICYDKGGIILFTFNPYTNHATGPWKKFETYEGINQHPWTLFYRRYEDEVSLLFCKSLSLDKARNIGGYTVNICGGKDPTWLPEDPTQTGLKRFKGSNGYITQAIFEKLNATVIDNVGMPGDVDNINLEKYDMLINMMYPVPLWSTYLYPHDYSGVCVVTRIRGYRPPIEEIIRMFHYIEMMLIIAGFLVSSVILKYTTKQAMLPSLLNVFRLLLGVASRNEPSSNSGRFFFTVILFSLMTLNFRFQTTITATLMVPIQLPDIDTEQELVDSAYSIFGSVYLQQFILNPILNERFGAQYFFECIDELNNGSFVACLDDCFSLRELGKKDKLHIAKNPLLISNLVFAIRRNWPLTARINSILQALREAGITQYYRKSEEKSIFEESDGEVDEKSMPHLIFALHFLGFGYCFALFVFVTEIVYHKLCKNTLQICKKNNNIQTYNSHRIGKKRVTEVSVKFLNDRPKNLSLSFNNFIKDKKYI